ncbi:MAG TPA: VOC family protein [bacterium]|nr:VOC family protein [bacterium]
MVLLPFRVCEVEPMARVSSSSQNADLPDATSIGFVHLTVADLAVTGAFYDEVLGFRLAHQAGSTRYLSSDGSYPFHLVLTAQPGTRPSRPTAGLYHFAILYPSREHLAQALKRLLDVGWPIAGASDHGVSEAIYLADPEGNGIELYVDRDRALWPTENSGLVMPTRPLQLDRLLALATGPWSGMARGTRIGHIHLRVSDLARAEAFYGGVLGFAVTVRAYPGALFFAAGGYHHHIGVNIWAGSHLAPSDPQAPGLRTFTIHLPGRSALAQVVRRLQRAGSPLESATDYGRSVACALRDPDGIRVTLEAEVPGGQGWQETPLAVEAFLRVLEAVPIPAQAD